MIRDTTALAEVRKGWAGVEALRSRLQVSAAASVGVIGGNFPFALANAAHNLPFIHAFAVLNDVLKQLSDEGHFRCKSIFLGELLRNSEKALPWQDFALISAGVGRRNDVAHRGELLERGDCWHRPRGSRCSPRPVTASVGQTGEEHAAGRPDSNC